MRIRTRKRNLSSLHEDGTKRLPAPIRAHGTPLKNQAELQAKSLLRLAMDLKAALRLPEFAGQFTRTAKELLGAQFAILALTRGERLETVYAHTERKTEELDRHEIESTLGRLASTYRLPFTSGSAAKLVGIKLARSLSWRNLIFVRLAGRDGELLGALCLANCRRALRPTDRNLIRVLAGHAAVALENSRLFSRIEQSKRQWVEDFDAISDLIVVHDPGNHILRVNRSLAEMLGFRPSEMVGMSTLALTKVVPNSLGENCPFCLNSSLFCGGAILSAGSQAFLVSTSHIGTGAEEGSRTIHILKDVTEQRRFQAQLQRERDFNSKILDHTQSMILVLDTAGLISYANRRCYETGREHREWLGRNLEDFIPPDLAANFRAAFEKSLRGTASENLEFPMRIAAGRSERFSVSLSPMRDEQGHVNSIVVVMTNITEAAILQAQLRHSEKMAALGQLVSGVAHEINNPLASIVGYADLLMEKPELAKQGKEELGIILQEAERTKEIVHNLLSFARQVPAKRELLDVNRVVKQALQLRAYGSSCNDIRTIESFDCNLPPVLADAHQLQQVFLNILNNAYDSICESKRPGCIEIRTARQNGSVEIAIRDNGTGVSQPDKIFEPFFTTKPAGRGTGLGLSICYGIIREHGGEVSCANHAAEPGCTFFVRLPVAGREKLLAPRSESARPGPAI